jgi:hypothetical protein
LHAASSGLNAGQALEWIATLYRIEQVSRDMDAAARLQLRQRKRNRS